MTITPPPGPRVDLRFDGPVAVITLDHPPLNIYDLAMRDELIEALAAVGDMAALGDLGAVVLRAAGRHFCAGADLSEFGSASSIVEARRIRWDRDPWGPLVDCPVPTVVALHGTALGSGLEMSLLCDIRVAGPDVSLGLPETKLGMLPAAGGTQSATAVLGPAAALPLVALATPVDADGALALGLVHLVVDDPDTAALAVAHQLAGLDRAAVAAARRALRAAVDLPLADGLHLERRLARRLSGYS
ncbi:MAG: enoyl-CoA hydratase/isomerase family protein [Acidimicrobiales bacterium]